MWPALVVAGIVSLGAVLFVLWPLFRAQSPLVIQEDEHLEELIARKDSTLRAIKDLEFDHSVGKIEPDDFQRFNQVLRRRALALLQQIERTAPQTVQLDETLEHEIAALRRVQDGRAGDQQQD